MHVRTHVSKNHNKQNFMFTKIHNSMVAGNSHEFYTRTQGEGVRQIYKGGDEARQ
jgi:hypothetical protein